MTQRGQRVGVVARQCDHHRQSGRRQPLLEGRSGRARHDTGGDRRRSALSKYVGRLNDNDVAVAASTLTQQINEYGAQTEKQTGFNAADLAADTEVQAGPNSYLAVRGQFDRKAADAGLRADPHWKSCSRPEIPRTTVYSWLKDNAVDMSNVHTDCSRTSGRAAVRIPERLNVLVRESDGVIHDLLDATGGDTNTLDAAKDYRAAPLRSTARTSTRPSSSARRASRTISRRCSTDPRRRRPRSSPPSYPAEQAHAGAYQLAAIGVTIKNGKPTIVVAVVNATTKRRRQMRAGCATSSAPGPARRRIRRGRRPSACGRRPCPAR